MIVMIDIFFLNSKINIGKPHGQLIRAVRMKSSTESCCSSQLPVLLQPELKASAMLDAVKVSCCAGSGKARCTRFDASK